MFNYCLHLFDEYSFNDHCGTFASYPKSFCFLYDITKKSSFEEIKNYWIKEIEPFCWSETIIAFVGNKYHLYKKEEVDEKDAKEYTKSINALFKLVSIRDVYSVNDLFYEIGKRYLKIKSSNKLFMLKILKYQKL